MIKTDYLKNRHLLKAKIEDGKSLLFDPVRKKYLVNEPEELVRQMVILYLHHDLQYSLNLMAVEKNIVVNKLCRRYDLLVYDAFHQPFMLVECKAPHVKINENTFRQIAWYNLPLQVPFLMVTNGISTFCCSMDYQKEKFDFLTSLPSPSPTNPDTRP